MQQCHTRRLLLHLLQEPAEATFLLFIQDQRAADFGRYDLPAPEYRLLPQRQVAQFLQPVHRGSGSARMIAQLLDADFAHMAKELQHRFLLGRGFAPAGGILHGFLRRGSQEGDLFGLVGTPAQILRIRPEPFFPHQIGHRLTAGILIQAQGSEGFLMGLAAQLLQQVQDRSGPFLADGGFFPAPVLSQGELFPRPEPKTCGQDHPDGFIKGAEAAFPQECRKLQLKARQDRVLIQDLPYLLQSFPAPLFHQEDHAFGELIGSAERHRHPLAGLQGHPQGDTIGIGLVDGKDCRRNSDFCDH